MEKTWSTVKQEIEADLDRIWKEKPIEVKASERGLFPSEAGSNGMATGNLVFQLADTYTAGFGSAACGMEMALENDNFTLMQCKVLFESLYGDLASQMGGKAKNGASWLNMPKVWTFFQDIVEVLPTIDSKQSFASLFWSWKNYLRRLNLWFSVAFNWEVMGNLRISKQVSDYEKLLDLTRRAEPYMKAAVESKI